LEELRQRPEMTETAREEVGALIYQTAKLSSMIHDLLLLSRLDAGRLQLDMARVDLTQLIDSLADDLSAIPSAPDFDVEVDVPRDMQVLGEKRYISMILQNLIENAWKYNRPCGTIAINAHEEGGMLVLRVGNTGPGIPADAQDHIFERFHRGSMGENVPGHGLGLNIARELALLHGGDLRLLSSDHEWTEFEVTFRTATIPPATT
jgi:signal transduction histidine kinase